MCHLHITKCMPKFPSYAILGLISSLFGRFFNGEVYIDIGVITPTWQSKGKTNFFGKAFFPRSIFDKPFLKRFKERFVLICVICVIYG